MPGHYKKSSKKKKMKGSSGNKGTYSEGYMDYGTSTPGKPYKYVPPKYNKY